MPPSLFLPNRIERHANWKKETLGDGKAHSNNFFLKILYQVKVRSLAAERLRPTGGTTDFWPQSFHATPIVLV